MASHRVDVGDAVVEIEGLALPQELPANGLRDRRLVLLAHIGEDRPAVARGGVDHREVADPGQCHLERARDRAGGERENVDAMAHRLHRFFVAHAEPLLFVDDQQAQPLEVDVLGQQTVRAHHDVDRAVQETLDHLGRLGARQEPAQHLDSDRKAAVAVAERLKVLAGQQRGRHEDRRLAAVLDRLEHRPQRHLGLAEPDVAADQAVHRPVRLHVGLHVSDRPELVGRLHVRERRLELVLPHRVGREGVAGHTGPGPVEVDQLLGDLARRGPRPGAGPLPVRAAHLRQGRASRPPYRG